MSPWALPLLPSPRHPPNEGHSPPTAYRPVGPNPCLSHCLLTLHSDTSQGVGSCPQGSPSLCYGARPPPPPPQRPKPGTSSTSITPARSDLPSPALLCDGKAPSPPVHHRKRPSWGTTALHQLQHPLTGSPGLYARS